MNIVHINTADTSGGAAHAAYALHKGLLQMGHNSRMLVGHKYSNDKEIDGIWFYQNIFGRVVQRVVKNIEERTGWQYLIQPFKRSFLRHPFLREADIIHLHNLHGNYFSFTILPELSKIAPIIWTLYDMWPMTGHCTYPTMYGCTVWQSGEGYCPSLFDYPPILRDTEAYLWRRKKEIYSKSDIVCVGPSQWMCDMARKSPLLQRFPIRHIRQGIDTTTLRPGNQALVRRKLDIPKDARVMMVSALPNAPRKGLSYFLAALQHLTLQPRPWILVVGSRGLLGDQAKGFHLREMGYVDTMYLWRECLIAADICVLPTLADNLPLTILDTLSCGTPVVAFDVGGVKEAVKTDQTGYLARYKDEKDFAYGMERLLTNDALRTTCSKNAERLMSQQFSLKQQVYAYSHLYEQRRR